jgi:hypothetical protein
MKHLKLYETKFDQNYLINFDEEKYQLYQLIHDFIQVEKIWNFEDNSDIIDIFLQHDMDKVGDTTLNIIVMDSDLNNETFYLSEEQLKKLYTFLKDPELYKAAKKYNL